MTTRYDRLEQSGDRLLREIGGQLRRGQITPAGLLAIPEYREVIRRGLVRLRAASGPHDKGHRLGT